MCPKFIIVHNFIIPYELIQNKSSLSYWPVANICGKRNPFYLWIYTWNPFGFYASSIEQLIDSIDSIPYHFPDGNKQKLVLFIRLIWDAKTNT